MKKFLTMMILVLLFALCFGAVSVYAEEGKAEDSQNLSQLVFYNLTLPSGAVVHQFSLVPSTRLTVAEDRQLSPTYIYLKQIADKLAEQLVNYKVEFHEDTASISLTQEYESLTDLYIANGETGFKNSVFDGEENSGFFFTSYTSKMKTVWEYVDDVETLPGLLNSVIIAAGESAGNIRYVYVYGTKYKTNAVSSDADVVSRVDGMYLHQFIMDKDSTNREISLVQNNPNGLGWYLVALAIGFAIAGVAVLVYFLKKKKEKQI